MGIQIIETKNRERVPRRATGRARPASGRAAPPSQWPVANGPLLLLAYPPGPRRRDPLRTANGAPECLTPATFQKIHRETEPGIRPETDPGSPALRYNTPNRDDGDEYPVPRISREPPLAARRHPPPGERPS